MEKLELLKKIYLVCVMDLLVYFLIMLICLWFLFYYYLEDCMVAIKMKNYMKVDSFIKFY